MKEATGELNMTVVTIVAIAGIAALLAAFWPRISQIMEDTFNSQQGSVDQYNTSGIGGNTSGGLSD